MKSVLLGLSLFVLIGCGSGGGSGLSPSQPVKDDTVSSGLLCSVIKTINSQNLYFTYEVLQYSTGDVLTICTVHAAVGEYSNTSFFRSSSSGASNGYCAVGYDVDSATSGYFEFTSSSGNNQLIYKDASSASNNYTYIFSVGDCGTL